MPTESSRPAHVTTLNPYYFPQPLLLALHELARLTRSVMAVRLGVRLYEKFLTCQQYFDYWHAG